MLDYDVMKAWNFEEVRQTYSRRDTILYALSVGLGSDPLDAGQLRFVYERELQAMPTMAAILGWPGPYWSDPRTGANYSKLVHGEQRLKIFKPLAPAGSICARERIQSLTDLGPAKGAVACVARKVFDAADDAPVAECTNVLFLRGDGGFSEHSGLSDPRPEPLPTPPERRPEIQIEMQSLPQSALLYRLNGDYNKLHADPDAARQAGFPSPILHGLCSFGIAAHAILKTCCGYDAARIRGMGVRFTAAVFPGEVLRFSIWNVHPRLLSFRAEVEARQKVVLDHGVVELNPDGAPSSLGSAIASGRS